MNFFIRSAKESDVEPLYRLALQEEMVHLPPDRKILMQMIEKSILSFTKSNTEDGIYIFVLQERKSGSVIGVSLIFADYATKKHPHYSLRISGSNNASGASPEKTLDATENHLSSPVCSEETPAQAKESERCRMLQIHTQTRGITATGGLVLDSAYRRRPEKLGKQISLIRFVYMAIAPGRFNDRVITEFLPPVEKTGKNQFWETIGKPYTKMEFREALAFMRNNEKSAIVNRFPKGGIDLGCFGNSLDLSANRIHDKYGRVVRHILESVGFCYLEEIDFDGGLIYGARKNEIAVVQKSLFPKVQKTQKEKLPERGLMGYAEKGGFRGGLFSCGMDGDILYLPHNVFSLLHIKEGDTVCYYPFS